MFIDKSKKIVEGKWNKGNWIQGSHPHWQYDPIDYVWLAQGIGADDLNSHWQNNPGNKDLKYAPIYYLCDQASEDPIGLRVNGVQTAYSEIQSIPIKQNTDQSTQAPQPFLVSPRR